MEADVLQHAASQGHVEELQSSCRSPDKRKTCIEHQCDFTTCLDQTECDCDITALIPSLSLQALTNLDLD